MCCNFSEYFCLYPPQTLLTIGYFRTLSPAQGTAWLSANTTNGSQVKVTPTVLTTPVRTTTIAGKPQTVARPQLTQPMPNIRSSTILSNAITLGPTVSSLYNIRNFYGKVTREEIREIFQCNYTTQVTISLKYLILQLQFAFNSSRFCY